MSKNGALYIISAPSGAGKTTLVNALVKEIPKMRISVSHTTRAMRSHEKSDIDYHFVEQTEFNTMLKQAMFLEHAQVFNHFYGTSKQWVEEIRRNGEDVILEIDWQGARQIRSQFFDTISIFILPPSKEALNDRLNHRHQDNEAVIESRMKQANEEMLHYSEYDYVVCNDKFPDALEDLKAIVKANRLRLINQRENISALMTKLSG